MARQTVRIGIIGDYQPAFRSHQATEAALQHAAAYLDLPVESTWLPTPSLDPVPAAALRDYDALWCSPGSPYQSMTGALGAIRFARENGWPLLGT
jgi:CTP synthase (UTP-ammonia lyase)